MESAKLIGKEVVGMRGWKIGTVAGINFEEATWKVVSVGARLFRRVAEEFRMKRVLLPTTIEVGVGSISAIGDRVILSVPKPVPRRILSSRPGPAKGRRVVPPLPEPPDAQS